MTKTPKPLRLQVFLSHSGVCSRRQAMEVIQAGRVKLNGQLNKEPSTPVDPLKDHVEVDGQSVQKKSYEYILLNKPKGYVTTTADFRGEKTVLDLLPGELKHLNPVGRLDKDTEGLLLLTNDGEVAFHLTHPKFNVDKIYFVTIDGVLNPEQQSRLQKGVRIEGHMTSPARIKNLKVTSGKSEFDIIIHEGLKRQIRLMLRAVGHKVIDLKRIKQGPLILGQLKTGSFRMLTKEEIALLTH